MKKNEVDILHKACISNAYSLKLLRWNVHGVRSSIIHIAATIVDVYYDQVFFSNSRGVYKK